MTKAQKYALAILRGRTDGEACALAGYSSRPPGDASDLVEKVYDVVRNEISAEVIEETLEDRKKAVSDLTAYLRACEVRDAFLKGLGG